MRLKTVLLFFILILILTECTRDKATPPPLTSFECTAQTMVTYTNRVKNILDQNCALTGCHLGTTSSGILLDTYLSAKASFESGNALCTIHHYAGCKAMPYPPSTNKMPDSLIAIIDCWSQKGFQN